MRTYEQTVVDLATDRVNDYLGGGTKHLYPVSADIARIYDVSVVAISVDVSAMSDKILAEKAV